MKKNQENTTISNVSTDLIKKRKKRRLGYTALGVLGVGIAAGAFFTLRHFGSALNHTIKVIDCAETSEIHQHDDSCYGTDEFGNEVLVCGYADYVVHTHNQYCYNDDGELICDLPEIEEHVHDDSCYEEVRVLVCDIPEGEEVIDDVEFSSEDGYDDSYSDDSYSDDTYSDDFDSSAEEEEIVDDADVIIEGSETPLAAVAHYHDDSCYEIRKVLVCGKLELHTHDDSCFDEYGNLICGIPELKEHEHTADCVTKRELTDEEIAALDRADPDAKTQPEEHTLTYECPEYVVTVTYSDLANIPEGAELVVKEITQSDSQYAEIEKEVLGDVEDTDSKTDDASDDDASDDTQTSAGETIFKALDISFVFEGQEIEPEAEVKVDIVFLENDFIDDDEITIHHITDEGVDVIGSQAVDESGEMSFVTESFSTFVVTTKARSSSDPAPGTYQGRELRYNDTENAFLTDAYSQCRRANGAVGQYASNFHLVAFDTVYNNVHVNGNILAKNLAGGANFGTNGFEYEVTYIQNLLSNAMMETGGQNKVVAVGSSTPIRVDNGVDLWIGNTKAADCSGANVFIKDIDSDEAPFINFDDVRKEIDSIMSGFASQSADVNVNKRLDKNYIQITNPDACGYVNVTADELQGKNDLKLIGFETGKQGSLIINVDCRGKSSWEIPTRAFIYFDAQVDQSGNITNGGRCGDTGEVTEFSDGKVIWNLLNCQEGMSLGITQMTGVVLAPDCDITVNMMNGNVVGRNITITGESHRTDFTGTTVPFAAKFGAVKTVDGSVPSADQVYKFELLEYWDGEWSHRDYAENNGSNINFNDIQFDCSKRPYEAGDHWYMIREVEGNAPGITFDSRAYLFHIYVTYANGVTSATYDNFRVADYTPDVDPKGGTSIGGAEDMVFDNKTSTSISVEKEWVAADGVTPYTDDLPDTITVTLYQAKGDGEGAPYSGSDAKVELKKSDDYKYTWNDLPRQDADGTSFAYYVVEDNVVGFTLVSPQVRKSEGTITLKNQKEAKKISLSVDKEFFVGNDKVIDPVLSTADNSAIVKFRLLYTYEGLGKWETQDVFPTNIHPENNGDKTQGSGTYTLDAQNGWHVDITGLPAEGFENGNYVTYQYDVVETECNLSAFEYKYSVPNKKVEIGREGASVVTGGAVDNGNYEFTIANYTDDTTSVQIDKFWFTVKGDHDSIEKGANENVVINLRLYNESNVEEYYQMSYDKFVAVDSSGNTISSKYTISDVQKWSAKVSGLPKYYVKDGKLAKASYKIEELTDENGFTYDEFKQDGDAVYNDDDPDVRVVTLNNRNTVTYDLPETGGRGTLGGAVTKWLNGHLN